MPLLRSLLYLVMLGGLANCNQPPSRPTAKKEKHQFSIIPAEEKFSWTELPGVGADISGSHQDSRLYYVGCPGLAKCGNRNGEEIFQWNPLQSSWRSLGGNAHRIAVDITGTIWVINAYLELYNYNPDRPGGWVKVPGEAQDIACGSNGSVWIIGRGSLRWEGPIYKYVNGRFEVFPGGGLGKRIAVDPQGNPWTCNKYGQVFRAQKNQWIPVPAPKAEDLAIDGSGTVWIMGAEPVDKKYCVYKQTGANWTSYPVPNYTFVYGGAISTEYNLRGNTPVIIIDRLESLREGYGESWAGKLLQLKLP